MKKFFTLFVAIMMIFLFAVPVMAGSPYVSLKGSLGTTETGGVNFSTIPGGIIDTTDTNSSETVYSPGLALGYDTGNVRFEFEYFKRGDVDHNTSLALLTGGSNAWLNMGGNYYDLNDIDIDWLNEGIAKCLNIHTDIETETFFLNTYADFQVAKKFELYVGAGIGMAKHKSKTSFNVNLNPYNIPITAGFSDSESNTCVAYNVTAGAAYLITDNLAVDLGLRYADLGEVEMGGLIPLEADSMISKEAILALRYTF